jgi:hypothetical protein
MNFKVITIPSDQVDQLENKLNQLLQKPEMQGFRLAASFPTSDFSIIVLIFQK